jgi:hypothetical protein
MMSDNRFAPEEISNWFWSLIARGTESCDKLQQLLKDLSSEELARFEDEFRWAASGLQDEPFTLYMNPNISEDGVRDIAEFVVSQGREFYMTVWQDPSLVPPWVDEDDPRILSGIAGKVHWEKFGTEISYKRVFRPYK